ncbi:unnamed protein product, partial [Polarella glacialis]
MHLYAGRTAGVQAGGPSRNPSVEEAQTCWRRGSRQYGPVTALGAEVLVEAAAVTGAQPWTDADPLLTRGEEDVKASCLSLIRWDTELTGTTGGRQRIFGASTRATYHLLGPENPADILLFADDIEVMGPDRAGRRAIVLTYLFLVAFGNPFKWEKQREGLKVDWIGLHTDYTVYKLGISEERCAWLVGWCTEVEVSCSVWPRVMAAGLGRLCYTANALFWERPFLGPIYAWVSSVGGLDRKEPPSITGEATELFRSDAKAEGGKAWIGAWETRFSLDP